MHMACCTFSLLRQRISRIVTDYSDVLSHHLRFFVSVPDNDDHFSIVGRRPITPDLETRVLDL